MFEQMTLLDLPSATSLPELPDGHSPRDSQDGQTTANCGPARRRASRIPSPEKEKARMMIGTYGPTIFASSKPGAPLSQWESRLQQRLASIGSTECLLTWKESATPASRRLFRLVPSTRPTDETAFGLWPTPQNRMKGGGEYTDPQKAAARIASGHQVNLSDAVLVATWPTPTATLADNAIRTPEGARTEVERGKSADLNAQTMALWNTPSARDWKDTPGMTAQRADGRSRIDQLPRQVAAALWQTPVADDALDRTGGKVNSRGEPKLSAQAIRALWPTPTSLAPAKNGNNEAGNSAGLVAIRGLALSGSSDTTEKPGALDPAFVAWLMGFPPEWLESAPEAMPKKSK
jgi:hypothetical protein